MRLVTNVNTGQPFEVDTKKFLTTHTLMQAITGGGKTSSIISIIEKLRSPEVISKHGYIPIVIIDERNNFLALPKTFKDFRILDSTGKYKELFKVDEAESVGLRVREIGIDGVSMILKVSDFENPDDREKFVANFMKGFRTQDEEKWTPCLLIIDEADIYVPSTGKGGKRNSVSRYPIIDATQRARQEGISILLATQPASSVHIDARRECDNRLVGNTVELSDRKVASELLGDLKVKDQLWGLNAGEFFTFGKAFGYDLKKIQVDKPTVKLASGIKTGNDEVNTTVDAMNIPSDGNVIGSMEKQITLLTSNQLTQEKYNAIFEEGRQRGLEEAKYSYKNKSLADRLLKR